MNTHPTATLHMANGSKIVIELLPESCAEYCQQFYLCGIPGIYGSPCDSKNCSGQLGGRDVPGIWTQGVPVSDSE